MQIVDLANFAQEVLEIVLLGKAGELRPVVEAGIDQRADTRFFELGEEGLGALAGKADGEKFHLNALLDIEVKRESVLNLPSLSCSSFRSGWSQKLDSAQHIRGISVQPNRAPNLSRSLSFRRFTKLSFAGISGLFRIARYTSSTLIEMSRLSFSL